MNGTTRRSVGTLTVVLAVFGGVVLLGSGAGAAVAGVQQVNSQDGSLRQDVTGVTSLDLEVNGAHVTVEFRADATRAQLQIEDGSLSGWSLTRDEDELKVRGPQNGFGWFGFGLFGSDWFGPDWVRGDQQVTLVLPEGLQGMDADLTLQAGSLNVNGEFGELDIDVNAGSLAVDGEARALDAELNAGRADIDLRGVSTAEYTVSAGRATSVLHAVPDEVTIDVSAGGLDLTLPDAGYALRQDVSAGSLKSDLRRDDSSGRQIRANVSAGSVTLRAGDSAE